jgi:hypothetical protein
MMTLPEFVQLDLKRLHGGLDGCLADAPRDALHAVPGGGTANTLAFNLFHVARTVDNVIRFVVQDRRPTVWHEGGYAAKLGLPPVAQGTGMPTAEAQALRINDPGLFRQYMLGVWAAADDLFARAKTDPALLDKNVTVKPLGEMPAMRAVAQICLTHGMMHFGEMELARTVLGLKPVYNF